MYVYRLSIVFGFVGWMMYTLTIVVRDHSGMIKVTVKLDKLSKPIWLQDRTIKIAFALTGFTTIVLLIGLFFVFVCFCFFLCI